MTHLSIDRRPPIAPIARGRTIIQIEDDIPLLRQPAIEHLFAEIIGIPQMHVLHISSPMNEYDGWTFRGRGLGSASVDFRVDHSVEMRRRNLDYLRLVPRDGFIVRGTRIRELAGSIRAVGLEHRKLRADIG